MGDMRTEPTHIIFYSKKKEFRFSNNNNNFVLFEMGEYFKVIFTFATSKVAKKN